MSSERQADRIAKRLEEEKGIPYQVTYDRLVDAPGWREREIDYLKTQTGTSQEELERATAYAIEGDTEAAREASRLALERSRLVNEQRAQEQAAREAEEQAERQRDQERKIEEEGGLIIAKGTEAEAVIKNTPEVQALKDDNPELYETLKSKGIEAYRNAVAEINKTASLAESERILEVNRLARTHTRIKQDTEGEKYTWVDTKELDGIKKSDPELYRILKSDGYEAGKAYIKEKNAEIQAVRADYERYSLAASMVNNYTETAEREGKEVTLVDGAAYLRENFNDTKTLENLGFSKEQIKEWQEYNASAETIGEMPKHPQEFASLADVFEYQTQVAAYRDNVIAENILKPALVELSRPFEVFGTSTYGVGTGRALQLESEMSTAVTLYINKAITRAEFEKRVETINAQAESISKDYEELPLWQQLLWELPLYYDIPLDIGKFVYRMLIQRSIMRTIEDWGIKEGVRIAKRKVRDYMTEAEKVIETAALKADEAGRVTITPEMAADVYKASEKAVADVVDRVIIPEGIIEGTINYPAKGIKRTYNLVQTADADAVKIAENIANQYNWTQPARDRFAADMARIAEQEDTLLSMQRSIEAAMRREGAEAAALEYAPQIARDIYYSTDAGKALLAVAGNADKLSEQLQEWATGEFPKAAELVKSRNLIISGIIEMPEQAVAVLNKMSPQTKQAILEQFEQDVEWATVMERITEAQQKELTKAVTLALTKELTATQTALQAREEADTEAQQRQLLREIPSEGMKTQAKEKIEEKKRPELKTTIETMMEEERGEERTEEEKAREGGEEEGKGKKRYKKVPGKDATDKDKRDYISKARDAAGWAQGKLHGKIVYHVVTDYNEGKINHFVLLGSVPDNVEMYENVAEAYKTIATISGKPPKQPQKLEGGAIDPIIYEENGKTKISFVPDVPRRRRGSRGSLVTPKTQEIAPGIVETGSGSRKRRRARAA